MRFRSTALCALFLVTFFASPVARADEVSKRAKVQELFVLTRVDTMMGQMVEQMSTAMKTAAEEQAAQMHLTTEQQANANRFTAKVDAIVKQALSMETLKPVFLKVYMDTYTEEELDGIIAFYKSPAGQAFVSKTPQLMQRSIGLMQQQMAAVQPQIDAAQREFAESLEKTSAPPAAPARK